MFPLLQIERAEIEFVAKIHSTDEEGPALRLAAAPKPKGSVKFDVDVDPQSFF